MIDRILTICLTFLGLPRRRSLGATLAAVIAFSGLDSSAAAPAPVIVVWSGWDHANIGDVGHTPGMLRTLEEFVPEARLKLFANVLDERTKKMLGRRFPKVQILEGWPWDEDGAPTATHREVLEDGAFFIRASNMGAETHYMPHLQQRGIPFGLYGQTYFPWFVTRHQASENLRRLTAAAFVYGRETLTVELLRRADLIGPVLDFMPDSCFGIDVRDDEAALATMRRLGLRADEFITLQVRTKTPAHADGELPPGYRPEWNRPAPDPTLDLARADKFVVLATAWVRATGLKVLIAPEAKKEMAHNRRLIYDRLPPDVRGSVVNLDHFWSLPEAAGILARARIVVCHEPHSPIIALANGRPAIHTWSAEHGPKYHMFADLGLGDWLFNHDDMTAEELIHRVLEIHRDYPTATDRVAACMKRVHALRRSSMAPLRAALGLPPLSDELPPATTAK